MSCLTTTNPATSEYLPVLESTTSSSDEPPSADINNTINNTSKTKTELDINNNTTTHSTNKMDTSTTIEAIMSCEASEFDRPSTPPASTPSPKVNKRKLKNHALFTGKTQTMVKFHET